MKSMKKDFQTLTTALKALTRKTEQIGKKVDKLEKPKTAQKRTTKAKVKTTAKSKTRTGLKKKATRKAPARKTVARKTKARTGRRAILRKAKAVVRKTRATKVSATAKVLRIVKRFKKGVAVPVLAKRTRCNQKKVKGILYKAFAQGKVRRVGRGLYAAV